jgi:hypothetical protein
MNLGCENFVSSPFISFGSGFFRLFYESSRAASNPDGVLSQSPGFHAAGVLPWETIGQGTSNPDGVASKQSDEVMQPRWG